MDVTFASKAMGSTTSQVNVSPVASDSLRLHHRESNVAEIIHSPRRFDFRTNHTHHLVVVVVEDGDMVEVVENRGTVLRESLRLHISSAFRIPYLDTTEWKSSCNMLLVFWLIAHWESIDFPVHESSPNSLFQLYIPLQKVTLTNTSVDEDGIRRRDHLRATEPFASLILEHA